MQQSLEQHLPEYTDLFYVDYREDLDEHEDIQEKCIRNGMRTRKGKICRNIWSR